ncbi:MAG TPA: response regulator [Verrucomicrobiota bacterium]|nr:response regulator [Verrucomicrobiota bacterium]
MANERTQMPTETPHSPKRTVYIVDDDISFLRSLSRLLRASGFHVVALTSATEFLSMAEPGMRGCLVTDLMMPGLDGMALQAELQKAGSTLPILFLTGHGDIPTTVQAMKRGAENFLTKHAPKAELIAAVNGALARDEQAQAERERRESLRRPFALLTDREKEVLEQIAAGELNKQIAADLDIHERTVKLHRTAITTKLGVHSVAELTRMVQEAGVL